MVASTQRKTDIKDNATSGQKHWKRIETAVTPDERPISELKASRDYGSTKTRQSRKATLGPFDIDSPLQDDKPVYQGVAKLRSPSK